MNMVSQQAEALQFVSFLTSNIFHYPFFLGTSNSHQKLVRIFVRKYTDLSQDRRQRPKIDRECLLKMESWLILLKF